jgi:hypothetical protein
MRILFLQRIRFFRGTLALLVCFGAGIAFHVGDPGNPLYTGGPTGAPGGPLKEDADAIFRGRGRCGTLSGPFV